MASGRRQSHATAPEPDNRPRAVPTQPASSSVGDLVGAPATPVPRIALGRSDRRQDEGVHSARPAPNLRAGETPRAVSPSPPFRCARCEFSPKLAPQPFRTILPVQNLHFSVRGRIHNVTA